VFVRQVPERLALGQVPAGDDVALGDSGRVRDGVFHGARLGVDVHLLAAGDHGSHSEGVVAAGEVGGVSGGAGACGLDVRGAVGGCGFVEPEGLVRG